MAVVLTVLVVALATVVLLKVVTRSPASGDTAAGTPRATGSAAPASSAESTPHSASPSATQSASTSSSKTAPSVHTPQGLWWGVDSTRSISSTTIANVRAWYRGHPRPQFWGRYLSGSFGTSRAELAYARAQRIYVYLIVHDRNCSHCNGGDLCGNDRTGAQAQADAHAALSTAHRLRLPARATLFKDIEQVSSCRGEPTSAYLLGWYHAVRGTSYRVGFYGNVHKQYYDFPRAYCRALAGDPSLGGGAELAMNENEPRIGAPRGTTGPRNAPAFHPQSPSCAPASATKIWQYGESLTTANATDIDQARPDTPGLLAPDGTATP
ncbi:glycoside hydrolase domain-containing protein [uncultured Jatrophihabitans sp.]|uniref:glycoside hydrolase domain-containing protein n=1 Tax=uncultured Jatrophihabitans sp. TaxID=1610747 RepID=UPI0035CC7D37